MYFLGAIVTFLALFCYWVYAYNNKAKHWFFKEWSFDLSDTEGKIFASVITLLAALFWPFTWVVAILATIIITAVYLPVVAFNKLIKTT